jgi:hypothetical protein
MATKHPAIVTGYAQMWPREVYDIKRRQGKKFLEKAIEPLDKPGIYVLYRDDHPYYVGKAGKSLFWRIHAHANRPKDPYYNFWNFFSVFVVPDKRHLSEVEGILIASMQTANSATPRLKRIGLPSEIGRILAKKRVIPYSKQSKREPVL